MKRLFYILSFSFSLIFLLISCEKEIEFKGKDTEPLVVINSLITSDSLISTRITKSKFFLSNKRAFDYVSDAEVTLYINHTLKETLTHQANGKYISTIKPNINDTVELKIQLSGYKDLHAQTIVPETVDILSCDTIHKDVEHNYHTRYDEVTGKLTNDTVLHSINGKLQFTLKIKDNPKEENYYRLTLDRKVRYEEEDYVYTTNYFFAVEGLEYQTNTDLFGTLIDGTQSQHLFTDDLLNGKEITLVFAVEFGSLELIPGYEEEFPGFQIISSDKYTVSLQSLNRDMYLYLKTIQSAPYSDILGAFSEPVQIYNNIENGLGIFGAFTESKKVFVIK